MKKVLLLFACLTFVSMQVFAQERTVTGTVSADDGMGLPGVSVVVKGTSKGTITDMNGQYSLEVPGEASVLIFQFMGMETQEVEVTGDVVDIVMESTDVALDDIVVTALGVTRDRKALGYSVQDVSADEIKNSASENMLNSLSGKVAGVNITSSQGTAGASSFIEIRGSSSITGNNQPLFVVDGMPINNSAGQDEYHTYDTDGVTESNRAIDINPDDIKSISVLKGGAATALYGLRAANGVVMITTKKGENYKGSKVRVNLKSSVTYGQITQVPELQTKYSQGSMIYGGLLGRPNGIWDPDAGHYNAVSWGPEISTLSYTTDPNYLPSDDYGAGPSTPMAEYLLKWDPNGRIVPSNHPAANGNPVNVYDPYDYFQSSLSFKNHLDVSGGNDYSTYYVSMSHEDNESVVPNNEFSKTSFKLSSTYKLLPNLDIGTDVLYVNSGGKRVQSGSNISGVMLGLLRTPPTFDNSYGYVFEDGSQRTFRNGGGYDNPYWISNKIGYEDNTNRMIGNINLDYEINDWLRLTYRAGIDWYFKDIDEYFSKNSNAYGSGYRKRVASYNKEFNADLLLNINKTFSDFNITASIGQNMYQRKYHSQASIANDLIVSEFYNMVNTSDNRGFESNYQKRTAAIFGDVGLSYKSMVFLNLTGRNEWSTTMPEDKNSFFYPSASLGFVFSELMSNSGVFTFGKVRASYARIANDGPAYRTTTYWGAGSTYDGWTTDGAQFPFNGTPGYSYGDVKGNNEIKPETLTNFEFGAELRFFNNKLFIDVAYFVNKNTDLLLFVPVAPSNGFDSFYLNAGEMETKGWEILIGGTPVKTSDFSWDITVNFSNPWTEVIKLADGVESVSLGGFTEPQVRAVAGYPYRTIFALDWERDANGNVIINDDPNDSYTDGFPMGSDQMTPNGDVQAKWKMGIMNSFSYKGFTLSALVEIKKGGSMWNGTKGALYYFGMHKDTESRGEERVWEGVRGHFNSAGDLVHMENSVEVAGAGAVNSESVVVDEDWYWWSGEGSSFTGPSAPFIEKTDWVKLREVSLQYSFPKSIIGNKVISSLDVYVTGTNLFTDTPYTGVDPETSLTGAANSQGFDYFNMPGMKTYTFGVRVGF